MLGRWSTHLEIDWWGADGGIVATESFKSRRHVQWRLRARFGAGNWRIRDGHVEVRQPYYRQWGEVGHLWEESTFTVVE